MDDDPYYSSPPAQWMRAAIQLLLDAPVLTADDLIDTVLVIDPDRTIYVRPGLSLDQYQRALGKAALYLRFGSDVVPEMTPARPGLRLAASHGDPVTPPGRPASSRCACCTDRLAVVCLRCRGA